MKRIHVLCSVLAVVGSGLAQASVCGDPPPVANETLKGEIAGKAQILSKYLGNAQLSGQIETSRTEIFSKYPNADERGNAYFEYQVCILLMNDKKMTTQEKLAELQKIRREFQKPIVKKHSILISPETPMYDNSAVGRVLATSSTVELKVDGKSIVRHKLDTPFPPVRLNLEEGVHSFEFLADVNATKAVVKGSCMGHFSVSGPARLQPFMVFTLTKVSNKHAMPRNCQLTPLS